LKVLIIQLRQLGDILLTTPVIRALKDHAPDAQVDFMTYPMGKLIIPGNSLVRRHVIAPQQGVGQALRFLREIRRERYDVVLDFMATPRSAVIARLIPADKRIAFQTTRAPFYSVVMPRGIGNQYIVREKFELLKPIGVLAPDVRMMLPWKDSDAQVVSSLMRECSSFANAKRRVMLSPTHRRQERQWPADRWAELALWLERSQQASVLWAWGPGEEQEIEHLIKLSSGAGVKIPKTTFRELAAITANCDLFIGNSNGPSHVAVAVNTPSLQLHGPTSATSWCPQTLRHRAVQGDTMSDILPTTVESAVADLWSVVDQHAQEIRTQGVVTSDADIQRRPW